MRSKKAALAACAVWMACGACGDGKRSVTVEMTASSLEMIDPYHPDANLARVRVFVDGSEPGVDVAKDVPLGERSTTFAGILDQVTLDVRAEGYDDLGNIVAYGQRVRIEDEGDVTVSFPLRRNLAYIAHLPNPQAANPERQLYLIDMVTRAYVGKVGLPGAGTARSITARGGRSLIVTYEEGGAGKVGVLDAGDHTWKSIPLEVVQDITYSVDASPVAVVAGGNAVSFVDVESGTYLDRFPQNIGGRVLDGVMSATGSHVLLIVDQEPGVLVVDVAARSVKAANVVAEPAGVGIRAEGDLAYITSSRENAVIAVDPANLRSTIRYDGANALSGVAAYSDRLSAVIALRPTSSGIADVLTMFLGQTESGGFQLGSELAGRTLINPLGVVTDGSGQRVLIPASGEDDALSPSGFTVLATRPGEIPVSSSGLYPTDPDDTYMDPMSEIVQYRRYRPRSAAIVYGR